MGINLILFSFLQFGTGKIVLEKITDKENDILSYVLIVQGEVEKQLRLLQKPPAETYRNKLKAVGFKDGWA